MQTVISHKKIQARFYELASGRKPVRDWLLELVPEDRRVAGHDIQTVEFGWPIGVSGVASMKCAAISRVAR
jgi:hypothetical protein